jgi:hypothetical protein
MAQRQRDPADFFEQIRANWAFEHLIVAVLSGAGLAGALTFALSIATALFSGASLGAAFAASFFKALVVCFLVFLIGFFSGVVAVWPLYRLLKGANRRTPWPYMGAAVAIAMAALFLVANMGGPGAVSVSVAAPVIISSIAIALIFARRVKPLWDAEEKAEAEAAPTITKLH